MAPIRTFIAAPSNLGLKPPAPGVAPGVRHLPEHLQQFSFASRAGAVQTIYLEPPAYHGDIDPETRMRNADAIRGYSIVLAEQVQDTVRAGRQAIVLGGDCSILLGCMLGLRSQGNYGLFFLDGHTDYMWPEHSATGGVAGMDLALVTGNGHEKLADIHHCRPYVPEQQVFCCGNRVPDESYVQLIRQSQINYYDLDALRRFGLPATAVQFLQLVETRGLDGFWVHLDVDVLHNDLMPCVDSPQPGGLSYAELRSVLLPLLSAPACKGIDITILDPTLDPDGRYASAFVDHLAGILQDAATAVL